MLATRRRTLLEPRRIIVRDSFDRIDNANTLGNAETGQPWSALVGTWGISSGKAYSVTDGAADIAAIDAGVSTGVVELTIRGQVSGPYRIPQVCLRVIDGTNHLTLDVIGTGTRLYKVVAGAFTLLATAGPVGSDDTDYRVRIAVGARTIEAYVNGAFSLRHTLTGGDETTFGSSTRWGMKAVPVAGPTIAARFNDFRVSRL